MSGIRYLSVYKVLFYYRIWRLPLFVLLIAFSVSAMTNLPILLMVRFDSEVCEDYLS
jgi:hypothetical protein